MPGEEKTGGLGEEVNSRMFVSKKKKRSTCETETLGRAVESER